MPPKASITKADILEKALEITRSEGFEKLTARSIAKALGCSTQPVFREYGSMAELKGELYVKARKYAETYVMARKRPDEPAFLSMGMAYVDFAEKEKNLMRFISMSDCFSLQSMRELARDEGSVATDGVPGFEDMGPEQARALFSMTWIFTHGIAAMVATNSVSVPENELKRTLARAYMAFAREIMRGSDENAEQ